MAIMAKKKVLAVAEYVFHFWNYEGVPLRLAVDNEGGVYITQDFVTSAWGIPNQDLVITHNRREYLRTDRLRERYPDKAELITKLEAKIKQCNADIRRLVAMV